MPFEQIFLRRAGGVARLHGEDTQQPAHRMCDSRRRLRLSPTGLSARGDYKPRRPGVKNAASQFLKKKAMQTNSGLSVVGSTESASWYAQLVKPFFAPPAYVFGPVWTVLYIVIIISFGYVLLQTIKRRLPFTVLLPFLLNLVFNVVYTPIQFGLKNNLLASLDILLILATLVWAMVVIWPRYRWVALVNIPYLLWVAFATVLQLSITWLNR